MWVESRRELWGTERGNKSQGYSRGVTKTLDTLGALWFERWRLERGGCERNHTCKVFVLPFRYFEKLTFVLFFGKKKRVGSDNFERREREKARQ